MTIKSKDSDIYLPFIVYPAGFDMYVTGREYTL